MSRWQRREDALWRETADRVIAMPPGSDQPVALTGSGVAVWHLLSVPMERDAIVRCLADLYRDPTSRMARDVDALLAAMVDQHMVEAT